MKVLLVCTILYCLSSCFAKAVDSEGNFHLLLPGACVINFYKYENTAIISKPACSLAQLG